MKGRAGCFLAIGTIIIVVIIIGALLLGIYNSLVTKSQAIDGQWAQVETQYQRRFDLIPNLVATIKGYLTQEQTIFTQIADARAKYSGAQTADAKAVAGGEVESALGRLLVIMENYPELKSVTAITQLMDELAGTENRISIERKRYNDMVLEYNTAIKKFPNNFMAALFNFNPREYFKSVSGANQAPVVDFSK